MTRRQVCCRNPRNKFLHTRTLGRSGQIRVVIHFRFILYIYIYINASQPSQYTNQSTNHALLESTHPSTDHLYIEAVNMLHM